VQVEQLVVDDPVEELERAEAEDEGGPRRAAGQGAATAQVGEPKNPATSRTR
jgi:hypothetical protein